MATAKKNRQQLTHLYTKNERLTCTTNPVTCEFRSFGRGSGPAVASGPVSRVRVPRLVVVKESKTFLGFCE